MEATLGSVGLDWGQWESVEIVRGQLGLSGDHWGLVGDQWDSVGLSGGKRAMYIYQGSQFKARYDFTTEETSNSSLISSIKFYSKLIFNNSLIKLKFLK